VRSTPVARALAVLATLAIAVLLLIPLPAAAEGFGPPESDKVLHLLLFGVLTLLWAWALRPARAPALLGLAAAVALYGGALELLQALTPYRSCDWRDFAADATGALLAAGLWRLLGRLPAWQTPQRD
jgi:VanZ family protein